MLTQRVRIIRSGVMLAFIVVVFALLIISRIRAYSLAPTLQPLDLQQFPLWLIPIAYIWDYFSHAWICLLFAFTTAGLLYEFLPKDVIVKRMGSSKASGYILASLVAPFFTVCSCTMIPLFAGIMYAGAGIGPAIAFLLMAPAANIMTILITGEILSWDIAIVRIIAALITSISAGLIVAYSRWGKSIEQENSISKQPSATFDLVNPPLDERLWHSFKFGAELARRIIPLFLLGLIAVSYLEAYMPQEIVATYLTGVGGVILASVLGGPLYTPTLVEIVLARALIDLGMSKGATLSWLMGQPYDIPNMVAASRIVKWKVVLLYAVIALTFSIASGLVYGVLVGNI